MRHLLLEGPSGVGKTTLLLNRLGLLRREAGGFVTQRMEDEAGVTCGFCLTAAKSADTSRIPYREERPGIFLKCGVEVPARKVFLGIGMELLKNAESCPFILLDEIGGVELLEPAFFSRLTELFSKNTPCIGVLKSTKNCAMMKRNIALMPDCFEQKCREFRTFLQNNPQVEIVRVERRDSPEAVHKIDEFIRRIGVKPYCG
jgi:Predicted nucleotide kinase